MGFPHFVIALYFALSEINLCFYTIKYVCAVYPYAAVTPFVCFIFSSEDGFLEFSYVMKFPLHVLEDPNKSCRKYKYHVESPLTQQGVINSLEFITGIKVKNHGVIDRYLKLHVDLNNECKFIFLRF